MILSYAEQIRVILQRQNKTIEDLARSLGTTRQNLWNQLHRDNFKYNDMQRIAAALGYDLIVELKEKEPEREPGAVDL